VFAPPLVSLASGIKGNRCRWARYRWRCWVCSGWGAETIWPSLSGALPQAPRSSLRLCVARIW